MEMFCALEEGIVFSRFIQDSRFSGVVRLEDGSEERGGVLFFVFFNTHMFLVLCVLSVGRGEF